MMFRDLGGVTCADVLAALPDYVDGALAADALARVVAHVQRCDACERFGGRYAALVRALRAAGAAGDDASDVPADVAAALDARLRAEP